MALSDFAVNEFGPQKRKLIFHVSFSQCKHFRPSIPIFLRSPETWVDGSLVNSVNSIEFNSMFLADLSQNTTQEDEWNLRDGRDRGRSEILEGLFPIGFPAIVVAAMRSWDGGTGGTPSPWEVRPPTAEDLLIVPKPQQVHPEFPEQAIKQKKVLSQLMHFLEPFHPTRLLAPLLCRGCPLHAAAEHLQAGCNLKRIWLR